MLDTAIAEQLNLIVRPAPCHMVGMKAGTRRAAQAEGPNRQRRFPARSSSPNTPIQRA
jgi:hypothetical protein